jgi:hypothetical protein
MTTMFKETVRTSHSFKQTNEEVWVVWWEGEFCEDGHELKAVFKTKESAIGWLHKNNPSAARVGIEDDCLEYQEKQKLGFRFWYIKKFELKN